MPTPTSISGTRGTIDLSMMVPAYDEVVHFYDQEYEGIIDNFMGRKWTPEKRISYKKAYGTDTGRMASIGKENTPPVYYEEPAYLEQFFTRCAKVGWRNDPLTWSKEIMMGKVALGLEAKIQAASKAHVRREEHQGLNFVIGDTSTVERYSTQDPTERQKQWDITSSAEGLLGNSWGTITGTNNLPDVLYDLDTIIYNAKIMGARLKKMIMGPKTFYVLQRNVKLEDDLKYVHDVRQNVVGATLRGLAMKEIVYARYKEDNDYASGAMAPGLGSMEYNTWSSMKTKHMMQETISDTTYEFALLTVDQVGYITKANFFTGGSEFPQGDDVTINWEDPENLTKYSWRGKRYGFRVDNWEGIHKLYKIVEV